MLTRLSIACIDPNRHIKSVLIFTPACGLLNWRPGPVCPPSFLPSPGLAGVASDKGGPWGAGGLRLKALVAARRQGQGFTLTGQPAGVNAADQYRQY